MLRTDPAFSLAGTTQAARYSKLKIKLVTVLVISRKAGAGIPLMPGSVIPSTHKVEAKRLET